MLVLSRKTGETVRVGSEIELVVLGVNRGRVKLGFAGPREVSIRRGEHADADCRPQAAPRPDPGSPCTLSEEDAGHAVAPLRSFQSASGV